MLSSWQRGLPQVLRRLRRPVVTTAMCNRHALRPMGSASTLPPATSSTVSWTSGRAVAAKLFLDQCVFAPMSVMLFYAVLKTLEGRPSDIRATWRDKLWPTLKAGYAIWPIANCINFLFVPSRQRVLYLNVIQVAWNVVLCRIASAEKPILEKRRSGLSIKSSSEPKRQTLSQYLQSMRKPGRHKDELVPLNVPRAAGSLSESFSRGKSTTVTAV